MHQFTDDDNRSWTIILNRVAVRKLWDLLRINLHDPADIARVCNQERYLLLPQMLALLCQAAAERLWPEAAKKPAELVDAFDDVLESDTVFESAHAAFCGELADFCRSRGRAAVAKYLDATPRLLAKEAQANLAALPDVTALEAQLDAQISQTGQTNQTGQTGQTGPTPGDSSTNTPEKLESAPTD